MLAPEHPSPLQSSQVYVLLLALQSSPSFFQKKNIRPHVTRVRIVRLKNKRLSLRTSCLEGGPLLCLERFTVEAETL